MVDVAFYPEDRAFELLESTLRTSGRTYELFHIAHLILEKPERLVAVLRRRPEANGEVRPLYLSLLDGLPFETEEETLGYILRHHLDEFFTVEKVELEPPKGKFSCVHRCGITRKLLAAPNDHRYRELLREHFQNEIHGISYEDFAARIETTREEADIQAWIEQMSHGEVYLPKERPEGVTEDVPLKSLSAVRDYCREHFRERMIRVALSLRIEGKLLSRLPSRQIRRSVDYLLQRQRQFPLDTANNLRGRLRRARFHLYRKRSGNRMLTFVCAVKRKFRTGKEVFEPEVQAVLRWLEAHPMAVRPELAAAAEKEKMSHALDHLAWLIRDGFVTEFEDGRLFLPDLLPEPEAPPRAKEEPGGPSGEGEGEVTGTDALEKFPVGGEKVFGKNPDERPEEGMEKALFEGEETGESSGEGEGTAGDVPPEKERKEAEEKGTDGTRAIASREEAPRESSGAAADVRELPVLSEGTRALAEAEETPGTLAVPETSPTSLTLSGEAPVALALSEEPATALRVPPVSEDFSLAETAEMPLFSAIPGEGEASPAPSETREAPVAVPANPEAFQAPGAFFEEAPAPAGSGEPGTEGGATPDTPDVPPPTSAGPIAAPAKKAGT